VTAVASGRNLLKCFFGDQTGAALVEMTIITPFMLTLAAGVFEFSNIIHSKLLIEAGMRDGARYFARCASDFDTCATSSKDIAVTGGTGTARVTDWTVDMVTVTYPQQIDVVVIDADTGEENYRSSSGVVRIVHVETDYPYTGTGLWSYLGFGALTLTAFHEERVMGN
jgi:Flp pilus assembly protein TadG